MIQKTEKDPFYYIVGNEGLYKRYPSWNEETPFIITQLKKRQPVWDILADMKRPYLSYHNSQEAPYIHYSSWHD